MQHQTLWLVSLILLYVAPQALAVPPELPQQYHATVLLTKMVVEDPGSMPLWEEAGILSLCDFWVDDISQRALLECQQQQDQLLLSLQYSVSPDGVPNR
ncbi:hypothetical protein WJX73_004854 [Symbiochloris irregularis]|uniref:Uncharacterized protein n=1 Tax=Symbiochloris irregularis TaxID=706552 RepID=A0AAW1PMC3_9CHLO